MGDRSFYGFAALHDSSRLVTDFKAVFRFAEDELCPAAARNMDLLNSSELREIHVRTALLAQSLLEFQDLHEQIVTLRTPMPNCSSYFFFEALSVLREAVVTGCNGSVHASLTLLRTFIELILFDLWWRNRLKANDKEWDTFRSWVEGKWSAPPLKNVMREVYARLKFAPGAGSSAELEDHYNILCRYTHKPLIAESLTNIRGSNIAISSSAVLGFWLRILEGVVYVLVDLMIAEKPQSLFPVEVFRKFGFNPPMGLFFDQFNIVPLEHALGGARLTVYKSFYQTRPEVEDVLSFFNHQPSMTDDEILSTWNDPIPSAEQPGMSTAERIVLRWITMKATARALQWSFAYTTFDDLAHSRNSAP